MGAKIIFDMAKVEALASRGLNNEQIASALGISERKLYYSKKFSAEFADAIKRGKAKGIVKVANALMEKALAGDTTAMIFFLKAQGNWREIKRTELTGADGAPIATTQVGELSNEELLAIAGMKTEDEADSPNDSSRKEGTEKAGG